MKNYRLGLVAEIDLDSKDSIKDSEWRYMFHFFRKYFDVVLFDWHDLSENLGITKFIYGNKEDFSLMKFGNVNTLCDVIFIGQLGKICDFRGEFRSFLDYLEGFDGRVVNSLRVVRSNFSKQYLLDLEKEGFPVVPTKELLGNESLNDVLRLNFGIDSTDLVVKPKVFGEKGVGVKRVSEFKNEEDFSNYLRDFSPVIVQPLIDSIFDEGEYSLVFVGQDFSHGALKFSGKFLIHNINLSTRKLTKYDPPEEEIDCCRKILSYFKNEEGYTRFDFLKKEGKIYISEVEMINPACFIEDLGIKRDFSLKLKRFFDSLEDES